jgi:hypothetical protein
MGDHHRIDIDVDHPGVGYRRPRQVVDVPSGWETRSNVEKLVNALGSEKIDRPPQEGTLGGRPFGCVREDLQHLLDRGSVCGEVVMPPKR